MRCSLTPGFLNKTLAETSAKIYPDRVTVANYKVVFFNTHSSCYVTIILVNDSYFPSNISYLFAQNTDTILKTNIIEYLGEERIERIESI